MYFIDDQTLKICRQPYFYLLFCCDDDKIDLESRTGHFAWAELKYCKRAREIFLIGQKQQKTMSSELQKKPESKVYQQQRFISMEIDCSRAAASSLKVCCLKSATVKQVKICRDCMNHSFLGFSVLCSS